MTKSLEQVQVVILAGGLGTRLRPLTENCPKPLVEVKGRPYLAWQLDYLKNAGFRKSLILTGYLGQQVETEFKDGKEFGLEISYSHESQPLGTGGALLHAMPRLEDEFVMLFGDSFLPLDYGEFWDRFQNPPAGKKILAQMAVYGNAGENTGVPNNVSLNPDGIVVRYQKGAGKEGGCEYAEAGVYAVKKKILSGWKEQICSFEADISKSARDQGLISGFISRDRFYDIGTPERLKVFEKMISDFVFTP